MNGGEVHPRYPDWWKASDGLWYPPELHPSRRQAQPVQRPTKQAGDFRRAMNVGFGIGCGLIALVVVLMVAGVVLVALLA